MDVSVSQIFGGVDVQLMKVLGGTHILQFAGTNILHVSQIFCIFSNPLEQFESSSQTSMNCRNCQRELNETETNDSVAQSKFGFESKRDSGDMS